jgi:hypothetical protein
MPLTTRPVWLGSAAAVALATAVAVTATTALAVARGAALAVLTVGSFLFAPLWRRAQTTA